MKTCAKCGEAKPLSEFHAKSDSKDGVRSSCKICWNAANKDWKTLNAGHVKSYQAEYRKKNFEKKKAAQDAWRAKNLEQQKIYKQKYFAENVDSFYARSANRRARKLSVGGKLTSDLASKLFLLQKGKCACCKKPLGSNYHMDHIMPLALGGTNTDDNIQLLRARCNLQKQAKHPVDFMQQRGYLL